MNESTQRGQWMKLAAVLVGTFTGAFNNNVANVAVLDVLVDFDLDVSSGAWFVIGYVVAFGVLMPVAGRLANRVGLRRIYVAGMALFTLASVAVAAGPDYRWVVLARVLQGIGAAPVLPIVMVVVSSAFPPGMRGRAVGAWMSVNGAALALSPVIGGLLVDFFGWRMIFWLDVPLGLSGLLLACVALPGGRGVDGARVDLTAALLLCGGLATAMLALSTSPSSGLQVATQVLCLAIGVVLLLVFWRRGQRTPPHLVPVVSVDVLRNRAYTTLSAIAGLQMVLFTVVLFATPLMLATVFGCTMSAVGAIMFMLPMTIIVFGPLSGLFSDRVGPRRLSMVGGVLLLGATALLTVGVGSQSLAVVIIGLVLTGTGAAAVQAPVVVRVADQVAEPDRGAAMGLFHSARFAGVIVGTSMAAAVLQRVTGGRLSEPGAADDLEWAFASTFVLTAFLAVVLLAVICRCAAPWGQTNATVSNLAVTDTKPQSVY